MATGYRTMDGIDLNDLWYSGAGIRAAVDLYRRVDLPMIPNLAITWPEQIMKYAISTKNGYQTLSPGMRPDRKKVTMAATYPVVTKYGYGVGTDLDTLRRSTGREVMLDLNRPMQEDPENVVKQFLSKMMTKPGASNAGYGFYNGSGSFATEEQITAPPTFQNNSFAATHDHYYGNNDTSSALVLADITAGKQSIRHHGHNGPLAGFINSAERQKFENLAAWTGNIIRTPVSDEVSLRGFGDVFEVLGVQWYVTEMVPAGYILLVEINQAEDQRPLVMFQPAAIQGLNLFQGPMNDYPLIESFFERWFGVKVVARGAGLCVQLTNTTAYTNPTFQ